MRTRGNRAAARSLAPGVSSYLSPLLSRPGAVAAAAADLGVAWHYGDPFREQRALATSGAVVDRSHRDVLAVSGPDRCSWLHTITSQHLSELAPWVGTEALVLSPHGHVEHHLQVIDDGTTTWLDVEPGTAQSLMSYLDSMRFMLRVAVSVVESRALVTVVGDVAAEMSSGPRPDGDGWVRRRDSPGAAAADLLVPRDALDESVDALGLPLAGTWAFEALRVEAGRPRLGLDTDHRTIPHEVGWIGSAVHLDKGCYRGQETVARVQNLGRPPRRLVRLHLDGSAERLPGASSALELDGRAVGFVGTSARHYELGPIALGLVKRGTPDEAVLTCDGISASLERVVDA